MILQLAALIVPRPLRADWLREWQAELFYVPAAEATKFQLGAFRDALWLRRRAGAAPRLDSPFECLRALAVVASLCLAIAAVIPASPRMRLGLLDGLVLALTETAALLPLTRLAMGGGPAVTPPSLRDRLRGWAFFGAKTLLAQPVVLVAFVSVRPCGSLLAVAPPFVVCTIWFCTFRWLIADQRRRCPVCLHLLTDPVRIGDASRTLLDWYGAESLCARGHGRLENSETPVSYSEGRRWAPFDSSWSALFHS